MVVRHPGRAFETSFATQGIAARDVENVLSIPCRPSAAPSDGMPPNVVLPTPNSQLPTPNSQPPTPQLPTPPFYPTVPSIWSSMSRFISTAYSMGSSLTSGSMNPLTIMVLASASVSPRLVR